MGDITKFEKIQLSQGQARGYRLSLAHPFLEAKSRNTLLLLLAPTSNVVLIQYDGLNCKYRTRSKLNKCILFYYGVDIINLYSRYIYLRIYENVIKKTSLHAPVHVLQALINY